MLKEKELSPKIIDSSSWSALRRTWKE